MKKRVHCNESESYISVSKTNTNSICIGLNEEGCKFLIAELQELIDNKSYIFDYDCGTGYDCGILSKDSLGLIIVRKDF